MRRAVSIFFALLLAGVIAAGWYAYDRGFTKKWRTFVSSEFHKRGVEVSLRQLALEPFRGIVARDLKIYDSRDRRRTVAVVDEMLLVINFANLFRGEPFIDALELSDARLAIPLDTKKPLGPAIEIRRLSGRLMLPPKQLYLSRLEAEIFGIKITASGRLINPQAFRIKPRDGTHTAEIERVLEQLRLLKFEAEPPRLDVRFSGDLAEPEKIFVEGTLHAGKVRRGDFHLATLHAAASFRDGAIELKQLTATDHRGTLQATGNLQTKTRELSVRLRSTLDFTSFMRSYEPRGPLGDITVSSAPTLELTVEGNAGDFTKMRVLGHLALPAFRYRSISFESLAADFSWHDGRWSARDVRLAHRTGELTGDAMQVPGDFRAGLRSTINPGVLAPLFTGKAADVFSQFEFTESPSLEVTARGTAPELDAFSASAQVKIGPASFRNSRAESVVATVRWGGRKLSIEPFKLQRAEGGGSGAVIVDFARNEVHLEKIHANVNPAEVIVWFDQDILKDVAPYRFPKKPPNVFVDGIVHIKHGKTTRLAIDVEAPAGMDYTFLKKNLSASQCSAKLLFTDQRLHISDLSASVFGGRLRGEADISIVKGKPGHNVTLQVENMDFASLTKLYFNYDGSRGKMDGRYTFSGRGDDPRVMRGHGEIELHDGNVFAIPFLGPFSGILNSIVPGMGHDVAHRASAAFTISEGVIATDKLVVEGVGFSMIGAGKLYFVDDAMDFTMRVNARGLPGVVLYPVSKLFEYVADDKLSKPVWRPKALPRLGGER